MVGVSDHGEEQDSSSSHQKQASEVIEGEDRVSQASNKHDKESLKKNDKLHHTLVNAYVIVFALGCSKKIY